MTDTYTENIELITKLQEENKVLKRCNKCLKYQLDNKPFPCEISSDGDCGWTRLNNYDALEGRR